MGKMFVMIALDRWEKGETPIVLKCKPERVLELSESFESIYAGLQQGRSENAKYVHAKHWITIHVNQEISDREVFEYIDECYDSVVSKFPKKLNEAYANL
jgi:predicted DNA-binding protein (MmcQ/YjbR family)